jgi:hypothetical protein
MDAIRVTLFRDVGASKLQAFDWSFDELADKLNQATVYPTKADCPLIKLATFGEARSDKGSLRHDANVIEITGIEADYDGEKVTLAEAQMLLYEQGIAAILYTSPSHTEERPRWRVLAPLSKPYPPTDRARFVGRLNGALGGILAPESFTLSQSYYAGRVQGAPYHVARVRGECIDLLDQLDAGAIIPTKNGDSKAERLEKLRTSDPVMSRLAERQLLLRARTDGGADIVCPFESEHTTPRAPGDCTYFPPHTGGFAKGHFHCLHSHCSSRSDDEFRKAIGIQPDQPERHDPPAEGESLWPEPLNLAALATREPERPTFIVEDWLPCGYATLLAGHGGVGKSGIALHLAVCSATETPFFGLHVAHRRVMYLSCEDRESVLHWRLSRICSYLGKNLADVSSLDIIDLVGRDAVLWERDPKTGQTLTPAWAELAARIKRNDIELLIVDGISDTFAGNENARSDVKRFVNSLVRVIPEDRGAVLLVGHVSKPSAAAGGGGDGYSGSTQWHNAVRARCYLYPETDQGEDGGRPQKTGSLLLELQKTNHGKADQQMRFKWDEAAHLFTGEVIGGTAFDRKHQEREELGGIRRAMKGCMDSGISIPAALQGPRTAFQVLSLRPEFPESLRGGGRAKSGRFRRHIETLRQIRHIDESSIARRDRHKTLTLILTALGRGECG